MSKKLKAIIVGYGKMGKIRAETIAEHPNMELIGVCEVNPILEDLGVPVVKDYKELKVWQRIVITLIILLKKHLNPRILCIN